MLCPECQIFLGNPCAICRTYRRIGFYIRTGLVPVQESLALSCLRETCGTIQDLVEFNYQTGRRGAPGVGGTTGAGEPLSPEPTATKPEVKEEELAEAKREPLEELPKAEEDKKKDKVAKTKKDKAKDRVKKEDEEPGSKKAPVSRKEKKRKVEEEGTRDIKEETEEETKEEARGSRDLSAAPHSEAARSTEEEQQERIDRFVSSNPETFGLGSLPVKGSAGRHFLQREALRRSQRPPEPAHPPTPRRDGEPPFRRRETGRSRSNRREQPKKKSKGARHRERGRQWRKRHQQW